MPRYLILFNQTDSASEMMANSTPEEMQAGMQKWMDWKEEADKKAKFDWGLPVQAVASIDNGGVRDGACNVSGHAFIEGDKDVVVDLLKTHPHLEREGSSIDLLEMLHMPGAEA